jgi:hypothetical protein
MSISELVGPLLEEQMDPPVRLTQPSLLPDATTKENQAFHEEKALDRQVQLQIDCMSCISFCDGFSTASAGLLYG